MVKQLLRFNIVFNVYNITIKRTITRAYTDYVAHDVQIKTIVMDSVFLFVRVDVLIRESLNDGFPYVPCLNWLFLVTGLSRQEDIF